MIGDRGAMHAREPSSPPAPGRAGRRRRAIRRRRGRRHLPPLSVFPTMCTLGNLVAGFAAIYYASRPIEYAGPWGWTGLTFAAVLVFVGMVFDAFDGAIARITRSTSDVGAQLDSLADVVTFGVAPAFMTVMLVSRYVGDPGAELIGPGGDTIYGRIIWGVAAAYVCCAALRLARFNVETPGAAVEHHMFFRGLPSPGAAGAVASLILLHQHIAQRYVEDVPAGFVPGTAFGIPFITLLCAFAMVSALPYVHVINRWFRGRRSFRYIVWLLVPLVLVIWFWREVMAAAFCAYALSAPMAQLWHRVRHRLLARGADAQQS
jgi:CDP-diacylglycerol---serine O-phosphatidyltransferase